MLDYVAVEGRPGGMASTYSNDMSPQAAAFYARALPRALIC